MAAGQETIQQTQLIDEARLRHQVSGTRSPEPVVEKAIGLCFHVIRETMSSREHDSPEPFRHAFLCVVVLRFLDNGTHSIDGEEGICFSRREQKGTWS